MRITRLQQWFVVAAGIAAICTLYASHASALTVTKEFANHPNGTDVFDFGQPVAVTKIRVQTMWAWEDGGTIGVSSAGIGKSEAHTHYANYSPGDGWLGMGQPSLGLPPSGTWFDSSQPCPDGACQLAITPGKTGLMLYTEKDDGGSGALAPIECRSAGSGLGHPDDATYDYCFGVSGYSVNGNAVNLTWYGVANRDIGGTFTRIMIDADPLSPPSNLSAVCRDSGDTVTLSWTAAPGAARYAVRVDNTANPFSGTCSAPNPGDTCNDTVTTTTFVAPVIPSGTYNWWVHTVSANGTFSAPATGSFSCLAPSQQTGTIKISGTINGTKLSPGSPDIGIGWTGPLWGAASLRDSAPAPFTINLPSQYAAPVGPYTLSYVAGAPPNSYFKNITYPGMTGAPGPAATQTLTANSTIEYIYNFTSPSLTFLATLNGKPISTVFAIDSTSPEGSFQNVTVKTPLTAPYRLLGTYTLTYKSGGPGGATLKNVTPSGTQTISDPTPAGSKTFTFNFVSPTISIRATLNGQPWSGSFVVDAVRPNGPISNLTVSAPNDTMGQPAGTYSFAYKSGGPAGATFQSITPSATQTLTPDGTDVFTFNFTIPTLGVTLQADQNSGQNSLHDVGLTAAISGNATGPINYTFYCNRSDNGTNVTSPWDAKFDTETATTKTADKLCNYLTPGTYWAKVIAERDGAYPATALQRIIVTQPLGVSCSVSPATADIGQQVQWTASAGGGGGSYSYLWSGDAPLAGRTGKSVKVAYSTKGVKTGSVRVTSSGQTITVDCTNSVAVAVQSLSASLTANPHSGNAPVNGVDLTAVASGTAKGTINYTFYCDRADAGTSITPGYARKVNGSSATMLLAADVCNYADPGTYTAKVIIERGTAPAAEARATITVSPPPPPPLTCSPQSQTINAQDSATVHANGGIGTYHWTAPSGTPASGTGQDFTTSYPNNTGGNYLITVTSGSDQTSCSVTATSSNPGFIEIRPH